MMSKLSTVIAATPETDLAVVGAMAGQFESYILRGEVYRTVVVPASADGGGSGERPVPEQRRGCVGAAAQAGGAVELAD